MYSWEIQQIMEKHDYDIPVEEYLKIYDTSPQITMLNVLDDKYSRFQIFTNDNCEWTFTVHQ